MQYDHKKIEKKWQTFWKNKKIFEVKIDTSKTKFYVLDMFPYPSGEGLHVGHVTGYTGTDIIARYKRQCGFNVLHPMGWDSFGLPTEQYAIRTGTHPVLTTKKNISVYRRQLESLGFAYDWSREIATSDPSYYKWTQWIFTKLYEKGLAYQAEAFVNYCPRLGTVLANEEVEGGRSKIGGYPIERKPLKQWMLKITTYAERLIADLDLVDWPENLKKLQINWIGKSEGAKIHFIEEITREPITVFTTRHDTIFGVSYLVLAPEHPLVSRIITSDKSKQVEDYLHKTAMKSELERAELEKEKNGIWTGSYAIHPVTEKKVPIWIADYVLMNYGTGAVMGVPASDERDFVFAKKYKLPILPVYDPNLDLLEPEELQGTSKEEIRQEVLQGKRCWGRDGKCINSAYEKFSLNGLDMHMAKELTVSWLEENKKGERAVTYKLRDWLFSRQRYWGEPIPILHYPDGLQRPLDLDELPLIPPVLTDFHPAGEGKSALAKAKEWVEIIDPKTKKRAIRETNTMPQWAGSCWYYLRFCDSRNDKEAWSKEAENYWMNVDLYVGGAEHAVLHLLYSRFWHKVLYDCGLVSTSEPFQTYRYQGLVTAPSYKRKSGEYVHADDIREENGKVFYKDTNEELFCQIEKMSKSKLNGVTSDEMIEEFGADALRLYEMFMGPFDKEKLWNTDAVSGCKRFLNRIFDLAHADKITEGANEEALRLGHKLVHDVVKDIEQMHFNTAIAKMMEFLNDFTKLSSYPKEVIKMLLQVLYPFAPHISCELWQKIGEMRPLETTPPPKVEEKYLLQEKVTFVIQINGKMRSRIDLSKNATKEGVFDEAKKIPQIQKYLEGEIVNIIFVPEKLLNIVIKYK